MANTIGKKYMTDENGEKFYPIGHTGAIYDSSGNTLDSALSSKASGTHTHTKSEITDFPTIPTTTLNGSSTTSASWYAPATGKNGNGGGVLYSNSSGAPSWTSSGTSGYFLRSAGANAAPTWSNNINAALTLSYNSAETTTTYGIRNSYSSYHWFMRAYNANNMFGILNTTGTYYDYFGRNQSTGTLWTYVGSNYTSGTSNIVLGGTNSTSYSGTVNVYLRDTNTKVVGTTTGYNTKIHVSASDPDSTMSNGDLWFKLAS